MRYLSKLLKLNVNRYRVKVRLTHTYNNFPARRETANPL